MFLGSYCAKITLGRVGGVVSGGFDGWLDKLRKNHLSPQLRLELGLSLEIEKTQK